MQYTESCEACGGATRTVVDAHGDRDLATGEVWTVQHLECGHEKSTRATARKERNTTGRVHAHATWTPDIDGQARTFGTWRSAGDARASMEVLVQGLVEEHGGVIEDKARVGSMVVVTVRLPHQGQGRVTVRRWLCTATSCEVPVRIVR